MADEKTASLLEKAFMCLEYGDRAEADEIFESVLNTDPENAEAYLGKLMTELNVPKREMLGQCILPLNRNPNFQKAMHFGDDKLRAELNGYTEEIIRRFEHIYIYAYDLMSSANNKPAYNDTVYSKSAYRDAVHCKSTYREAAKTFRAISDYKDSAELAEKCDEMAEIAIKDHQLYAAKRYLKHGRRTRSYQAAADKLKTIPGWKDADELLDKVNQKLKKKIAAKKRIKKAAIIITSVLIVSAIIINKLIIPNIKYKEAVELEESGQKAQAAITFGEISSFKDSRERSFALWNDIAQRDTISATDYISALKSDGTVVAVCYNDYNQCDVSGWKDIIAISCCYGHIVGLKADGTVVASCDDQCDVSEWTDIVAISAGGGNIVGLKADGTVVAVGNDFINDFFLNIFSPCRVDGWRDIVAISTGIDRTVGLKVDGTVVATVDIAHPVLLFDYGGDDVS